MAYDSTKFELKRIYLILGGGANKFDMANTDIW